MYAPRMLEPEPRRAPDGSDQAVEPAAPGPPETTPGAAAPYEIPSARKVVSSGLALSLASTADLRRGSIYIGLLVLGAFGPALVAFLMTLGRLGEGAGDALGMLLFAPEEMAITQPELGGVLLVLMLVAIGGLALFGAISVDAQSMAIAILGGRASGSPLRLWESIRRARQVFWRIAGAGFLVGVISLIFQGVLLEALSAFSRSDTTLSLVTAIVATVLLAPFAYVSTGIVLGDVGAIETLSRSWRLFRARPALALVVVLFTLVTEAIQLFALGAGLDLVVRAGELLQVSLTESALAFLVAVALILAAIVAFGSLSFTVAAIVSAPQVTGFLGLTFFSGGLDRARGETQKPPPGFRWITRPMLALMVVMALVVGLEIPAINAIPAVQVDPMVSWLRGQATGQPLLLDIQGTPAAIDDPAGDVIGAATDAADMVLAEMAFLGDVPAWLLEDGFGCDRSDVACSAGDRGIAAFDDGALLFLHRLSAPLPDGSSALRVAVLLDVEGDRRAPRGGHGPYAGASRSFVTSLGSEPRVEARTWTGTTWRTDQSSVRSTWSETDVVTIVPFEAYGAQPIGWDLVTVMEVGGNITSRDTARLGDGDALLEWDFGAQVFIDELE